MNIKPIDDGNSRFDLIFLFSNHKNITITPHCKIHHAMNKVSVFDTGAYWRCLGVSECRGGMY